MMFDEDMLKKAVGRYLHCPFCGKREWLKVRVAVKYDLFRKDKINFYSIRCEWCKMAYGEENDCPLYDSQSALLADWNRRKY